MVAGTGGAKTGGTAAAGAGALGAEPTGPQLASDGAGEENSPPKAKVAPLTLTVLPPGCRLDAAAARSEEPPPAIEEGDRGV
jgi:hypothetical protein